MIKLEQLEYSAIKKELKSTPPEMVAQIMQRSLSCIMRIDASKNYDHYIAIVKAEHIARKPRMPLREQLRKAKMIELMGVKNRVPRNFWTKRIHKYLDNRLLELRVK